MFRASYTTDLPQLPLRGRSPVWAAVQQICNKVWQATPMDCLTFITKLIEFLAWPLALVIGAFALRAEIRSLLPQITKFEAGPVRFELAQIKKEVESAKDTATAAINKLDEPAILTPVTTAGQRPPAFGGEGVSVEPEVGEADDGAPLHGAGLPGDSPGSRLAVLRALGESKFAMRSLSGIKADTGLDTAAARAVLGGLEELGWVSETRNASGQRRYFLTTLGSQSLLMTRVHAPQPSANIFGQN
ncbi:MULTISPECIES: helix-turn-helix domain-containing protein [unclassified Variovorax]|uniref:helix-turn-helix domain-containing protein n=1 Tax=unclassified Variovorax TaxID=663243 RepID=UPI0034E871F2